MEPKPPMRPMSTPLDRLALLALCILGLLYWANCRYMSRHQRGDEHRRLVDWTQHPQRELEASLNEYAAYHYVFPAGAPLLDVAKAHGLEAALTTAGGAKLMTIDPRFFESPRNATRYKAPGPMDPFSPGQALPFAYWRSPNGRWALLFSPAFDRVYDIDPATLPAGLSDDERKLWMRVNWAYDSTNGSLSAGDIFRLCLPSVRPTPSPGDAFLAAQRGSTSPLPTPSPRAPFARP